MLFFGCSYAGAAGLSEGAAYWPQLICIVGAVLSLLNAAFAGVGWYRERGEAQAAVFPLSARQLVRSLLLLALAAVWVFAVPYLGYLVSSVLATCAVVLVFEPVRDKKHVIRDVVVTLIFSLVMYQLFSLLGVHFPKGLFL